MLLPDSNTKRPLRRTASRTPTRPPSGHVFRAQRKRGPVWYAKYRLPDGRQLQRKLGPAWTERGRPPGGYFTKRVAEDWLRNTLDPPRLGYPCNERRQSPVDGSMTVETLDMRFAGKPPQRACSSRMSSSGAT